MILQKKNWAIEKEERSNWQVYFLFVVYASVGIYIMLLFVCVQKFSLLFYSILSGID